MTSDLDLPRVPYVTLQTYLGNGSDVSIAQRGGGRREYLRVWSCGCRCAYADSPRQTARWRACKTHAPRTSAPHPFVNVRYDSVGPAPDAAEVARILGRRIAPRFFIVDRELNVLAVGPVPEVASLVPDALQRLAGIIATVGPALLPFDDRRYLRIVPLGGPWSHAVAVFVEDVSERGSVEATAKRFGLTRREVDVLRLIVNHQSNAEIARRLCIAESTVGDHIKSLFRKTNSTRRTELLTKIFGDR